MADNTDLPARQVVSPRGPLLLASCRSAMSFVRRIVEQYRGLPSIRETQSDIVPLEDIDWSFHDSEICVRLTHMVNGYDVFLFQSLFDPTSERSVNDNYAAALMAARTLREHGATHVTAVFPYLAYSRQDKPTAYRREPTTARLMADVSIAAGIDRLLTWHVHSPQVRGFYGAVPVNMLDQTRLFVEHWRRFKGMDDTLVVAPDLGASKAATMVAGELELDAAVGVKLRQTPDEVNITQLIGGFQNKTRALIIDDILSTGGTIHALTDRLVGEQNIHEILVAVSHNLCTAHARDRLLDLYNRGHLKQLMVTDSIPQTREFMSLPFVQVQSLADRFARAVNRLHYARSLSAAFGRGR